MSWCVHDPSDTHLPQWPATTPCSRPRSSTSHPYSAPAMTTQPISWWVFDLVVGIRSGAGDPIMTSECMSWFPSRTWWMAGRRLLLSFCPRSGRRDVRRPVLRRAGVVITGRKVAVHEVSAGRGEWSSPVAPVHPDDYCRIVRPRDDRGSACWIGRPRGVAGWVKAGRARGRGRRRRRGSQRPVCGTGRAGGS
jgi:hypothetical protein